MFRHATRKTAAAALLLAGLSVVAIPTPAVATPNTCGGVVSDYTGTVLPPVPFTGFLTVVIENVNYKYPISITSQAPNSNLLQVNATLPSGDEVSSVGGFTLDVDTLGKGMIRFPSPTGSGRSVNIVCSSLLGTPTTRVTKMIGKMTDPTVANSTSGDFNVSRPGI
ncbi:hypothetical protein [Amycolatopsis speibonae]|uniref:Uncharacterized protein n=1 Tax=Amycolatopsis speibonae TaxID=1450224 RepID=A0ABV7PA55_9PSEU